METIFGIFWPDSNSGGKHWHNPKLLIHINGFSMEIESNWEEGKTRFWDNLIVEKGKFGSDQNTHVQI
jgi:hypothetical protein